MREKIDINDPNLKDEEVAIDPNADAFAPPPPRGVSVNQVAQKLGLDESTAWRRVQAALKRGYLRNLETRRRQPARLVLGDPLPDDVQILPDPEVLQ